MKTMTSNSAAQLLICCFLAALGSNAFATSTWTYSGGAGTGACASTAGSGLSMGNSLGCGTIGGVTMDATAFSTSDGKTSNAGTTFATAAVYNWSSGLGVVNVNENAGATGPHATDNRYGTDAILLHFSSAVSLTNVGIGWSGTSNGSLIDAPSTATQDSDFSVLAYQPGSSPTVAGKTLDGSAATSTLISSGWKAVGNYADKADGTSVGVTSTIYSSYWLISAYNTAFGLNCANCANGGSLDAGNDYFKLASVSAQKQQVPEPSSLALLGLGLVGLVAARRRSQKSV